MQPILDFFLSASSLVGLGIVLVTLFDATMTVIGVSSGAGRLTRWVSRSLWLVLRRLQVGRAPGRVTRTAGPLIVLVIIHAWLVLVILGWALVFGQEGSLLQDGEALTPALGRLHYAGSLVLGGGGSFTPAGGVWRFAEKLAQLNGVAFVGIAVAYVLPVVGAVVHKRQVAATISTLGESAEDVLVRAFNGRDFGELGLHLIALTPDVAQLAQRHLAYPVIAYFHSSTRHTALAPAITVLDDVVTLLAGVVDERAAPDPVALYPCQRAVTTFLAAVDDMGIHAEMGSELPRPDLDVLRDAGIPLRDDEAVQAAWEEAEQRRRELAAYLHHDGVDVAEVAAGEMQPGGLRRRLQ